ncbi:hypothetical protein AAY473_018756, partial [Plecturocebus cupreus]
MDNYHHCKSIFWLEYNGMILDHCNLHLLDSKSGFHHVSQADLKLLTSGDLPTLASQTPPGITGMSYWTVAWAMGWAHAHNSQGPAKYGPLTFPTHTYKLPSCLMSTVARVAFLLAPYKKDVSCDKDTLPGTAVREGGLTLLARLEYSGTIVAHCSLDLLGSRDPVNPASHKWLGLEKH